MYYTTQAIVLSSAPQGERGKLMHLLTEARGLVIAHGQGVMAPRSKLGPKLTQYRLLTLNLVGRVIDRIIGVEVLETYEILWRDPLRQGYAAWAQAIVQNVLKPGVKDVRIFEILREYLEHINDVDVKEQELPSMRLAFACRLNHFLGHALFTEKIDTENGNLLQQALSHDLLDHMALVLMPMARVVHERVEAWVAETAGVKELPPARFLRSFAVQ